MKCFDSLWSSLIFTYFIYYFFSGLGQRGSSNFQLGRDSLWLNDMLRQLQQISQQHIRRHNGGVDNKRVLQHSRWYIHVCNYREHRR